MIQDEQTKPVSGTPQKALFLKSRLGKWSILYLLMLPSLLGLGIFGYYPKVDVIQMSFFRWIPNQIEEFIGFKNYIDVFNDPLFWQSFKLIGILLAANLVKMIPAIIAAVALHRMISDRWRYYYQICFVIPMVIPGLVWLLIWKSFYDADFGILNRFLNLTGIMEFLRVLDGSVTNPGVMPQLAGHIDGFLRMAVNPVFGSVWGLMLAGGIVLTLWKNRETKIHYIYWANLVCSLLPLVGKFTGLDSSPEGIILLMITGIVIFIMLSRKMGQISLIWALWMLAALLIFHSVGFWYYTMILAVAFSLYEALRAQYDKFVLSNILQSLGYGLLVAGILFVLLGKIWTEPTSQFMEGTPAWLGNKDLVIPAVVFWGFPWVGTVGVLIYLAGLHQISDDVYEAAELDGVGPIGMFFRIELPLIMTQVRINLIFITIGTLTQYEFFLLLLGTDGGPGNKGMVPGLYMFKKAFEDGFFGYACALGMVLFVLILILTVIYNNYVKVEK